MPQLSAARWKLARAWFERPTFERMAAVLNVHESTLRRRAVTEGWQRPSLPKRDEDKGEAPALFSPDELEGALADLPEGQREAIRLRVVVDLAYEQVAASLGTTPEAARVRVHRGLASLRNRLSARSAR